MAQRQNPPRRKTGIEESLDDRFIAQTLLAWHWMQRHANAVIVGAVSVAVLIGAVIYYAGYRRTLRQQAAQELEQAQQILATGGIQAAKNQFQAFIARFGNTDYAAEATIILGELHLLDREADDAIRVLEPRAADLDDPLGTEAALLTAAAHEQAGRLDDAERVYLRVADDAPHTFYKRDALEHAARTRNLRGDAAGARDLYARILALIPQDDPLRPVFELRHAEFAARAEHAAS